jgi:hypothetical protein
MFADIFHIMRNRTAVLVRGATPVLENRRKYPNLNALIKESHVANDRAKLAAFRWATRNMAPLPDVLADLDGRVERKEECGEAPERMTAFPNIMKLFGECSLRQRLILVFAATHLPDRLQELESNLERNECALGAASKG